MIQQNREGFKVYAQYIQDFLNKEKSFYQYKTDPDLSVVEKRLLKSRQLLRQGEFNEMLSLLGEMKSMPNLFFEAEVNILKSQAYSFLLDFQQAAVHNLEAHQFYKLVNDQFGIFISLYNLSVDYSRLNLDSVSLHYLEQAKKIAATPNQKGLILRADACRYAKEKNISKAIEALTSLKSILNELNEFDRLNSLTVLAASYTEMEKYEEALEYLEAIENKNFFETKNKLQLDFVLLQYLVKGVAIPAPQVKEEQNKLIHMQWKLLYLLVSGQMTIAREVWNELKTLDPILKEADFCQYSGNDIFGLTLKKIYQPKEAEVCALKGKLHDLFIALKDSPLPLSKEELIERVWKIKYEADFDDRLYRLIARLRKDFNIKIISKSSGYSIAA